MLRKRVTVEVAKGAGSEETDSIQNCLLGCFVESQEISGGRHSTVM